LHASLRVYSQNVCVLPAGARERVLQHGGVLGMALIVLAPLCAAAAGPLSKPALLAIFLAYVSGAVVPLSLYCVFLFGAACHFVACRHDHKRERLAALANRLVDEKGQALYDVVLIQELFGTWYSDANRQFFVAAMKERGYAFTALPSAVAVLPSTWANSGLAIFSPWPLSDETYTSFQSQMMSDFFAVNRGALGATVHLPSGQQVRAFSTHFAPPLAVLDVFEGMPKFVHRALDVHPLQAAHLAKIVSSSASSAPLVVGGDFNAHVHGEAYRVLCSTLDQVGLENLSAGVLEANDAPITTNPPGETLLTGGGRSVKILDYIFASRGLAAKGAKCRVLPQATPHQPFQFVSDHFGVAVEVSS